MLRTVLVRNTWRGIEVKAEVHTFLGGTSSPQSLNFYSFNLVTRSVHNCRIERLWLDYARGVVVKWKPFFEDLELHYDLDHLNFAHIWLLHHLFLHALDADTQAWAESWNLHRVSVAGEGQRSPREMFLFGMVRYGIRGVDYLMANEPAMEDEATYGVDWSGRRWISQALRRNPEDWEGENPFHVSQPERLSEVICDEPDSPLTPEQINRLDTALSERVDMNTTSMDGRKLIWQEALQVCLELNVRGP